MRQFCALCVLVVLLLLLPFALFAERASANHAAVAQGVYKFPIYFETNLGQSAPEYRYIARQSGIGVALAQKYAAVSLRGQDGAESIVEVVFVHSSPQVEMVAEQPLPGHANYLFGSDPKAWKTHVPLHSRVSYREVYSGIDLSFYGELRKLEYDFTIAPGSDPRQIGMQIQGADSIRLNGSGDLILSTANGTLSFRQPVAYQDIKGEHRKVESHFRVRGSKVGFEVGDYDHSQPLIIDPVLAYSTYVAGDNGSTSYSIAVDSDGSAYIVGLTFSSFPTQSPFQATCKSCPNSPDLFITKLSPDGSSLVYSTYLGGSNYDEPAGIAVDSNHNAVVVGRTQSTDFPTLPAHTTTADLRFHGFVASLAPTGDALNWSRYIAGSYDDSATAVAVDPTGSVFVTGYTDSPDFPATPGTIAHETPGYPNNNAFVMKFSDVGEVQYSAVLPNASNTSPYSAANPFAIGVDADGNAVIAGSTGLNLVTTPGAFQTTPGNMTPNSGGSQNGFITKIDSTASSLLYSTYFGGSQGAPIRALALDAAGATYITGTSPTVPVTPDAFQSQPNGTPGFVPGFVAKFDSNGSLVYCTYVGPAAQDSSYMEVSDIAVDSTGNAYISGYSTSTSIPLVNPLATSPQGAYVAALDPSGSSLLFSTYLSGTPPAFTITNTGSRASGIALDGNGKLYVTGTAYSADFPTTAGAYQRTVSPPPQSVTGQYPFVAKIDLSVASPSVCLAPLPNFSYVQVGYSRTRTLTVTNCGNAPLTVSAVNLSGTGATSFSATNSCATATSPGNTCTIAVTFSPSATGDFTADLTLSDNAPIPTQKITVNGNGAVPTLSIPNQLTVADVVLGTSGAVERLFVRNNGFFPVHITGVSVTGDFAEVNQCPATLNPGSACLVNITFTPTDLGIRSGILTVQDDANGGPHTVSLSGNALAQYPTPVVQSSYPTSIQIGGNGALQINGSNFFPASIIRVNGVDYPTTYSYPNYIATTLTASDISQIGELSITVVNPAPGGESNKVVLPVYAVLGIDARWLTFDPWSRQIYASVGNTVVPVDPTTGQTGTPILVGNKARQMDISSDGRYLYVGLDGDHAIQRVDLYTNTSDQRMELGSDWLTGNTRTAGDIRVMPDHNKVLAVVTFRPASPSESSLNLYSDGTLVGSLTEGYPSNYEFMTVAFDPADTGKLYGIQESSTKNFVVLNVTSSSLTVANALTLEQGAGISWSPIVALPGQIYATSGDVINPVDGTKLFHNEIGSVAYSVLPNPDLGLVYYLDLFGNLEIFNSAHQALGSMGPFGYTPFSLVRSSNNRFAAIQGGSLDTRKVVLFQVSTGQPTAATTAASPTSVAPHNAVRGSGNTLLTLSGSDFVPGATVFWNGLERTTRFVDASHLEVKIPNADLAVVGTAAITVVNPGTAASAPINFPILERAGTLSPSSLSFGNVALGTSATLPINFSNAGPNSMAISQISTSAPFSQQNDCGTQLASGATCTIQVTFTPDSTTESLGSMTISEGQDSQNLAAGLSGAGIVPTLTLSSNQLSFDAVMVGESSSASSVTLTNSGQLPVAIDSLNVSGDFTQTNDCGNSLAVGVTCHVQVVFKPTAAGSRQGTLVIKDNATGAPHPISLQGNGSDLQLGAMTGGSSSAIVSAGQTANYTLNVGGAGGFSGTVTLACTGAPQFATCAISPPTVAVAPNGSTIVSVSVTTSQTVTAVLTTSGETLLATAGWTPMAILTVIMGLKRRGKLTHRLLFVMILLGLTFSLGMLVACGGGGSSTPPPQQPQIQKVAPGTYTITVTATSGTVVRQTALTLIVQ